MKKLALSAAVISILAVGCGEAVPTVAPLPPPCDANDLNPPWSNPCPGAVEGYANYLQTKLDELERLDRGRREAEEYLRMQGRTPTAPTPHRDDDVLPQRPSAQDAIDELAREYETRQMVRDEIRREQMNERLYGERESANQFAPRNQSANPNCAMYREAC